MLQKKSRKNSYSPEEQKTLLESTAIRYLSYRPRFKAEVVNRLAQKAVEIGMSDPIALIDQIIISLEKSRFIDDEKLLESFIRNKLVEKAKGPYWIRPRLLHFGLSKSLVEAALKEYAPKKLQLTVMKKLFERKTRGKKLDLAEKMKIGRLLASRGFGHDLISEIFDLDGQLE